MQLNDREVTFRLSMRCAVVRRQKCANMVLHLVSQGPHARDWCGGLSP